MRYRTVLSVLLAALLALTPAAALAAAADALLFTENPDGTAEVAALPPDSPGGALIIPAETNGHAVTSIASGACRGCRITQAVVPEGVLRIGDGAFADCPELAAVSLPASCSQLGTGLFAGSGLRSFSVPQEAETVPENTFDDCTDLAAISIPASVTAVAANAFSGCTALRDVYYAGSAEEYASITVASGNEALQNARLHAAAAGPADLIYNIEGASVGDNLTVEIVGLSDPERSGAVRIPAVLDGYPVTAIGPNAFERCVNLTAAELPDSLQTIGADAFRYCAALESVTFGESLTSLGAYAFSGCTALTAVALPDSLREAGDFAFAVCPALESAVLPNSMETPGEYLFAYSGLTSFRVPRSWTGIPKGTFQGCSSLATATIPAGIYAIGEEAFAACGALKNVYLLGSDAEADSIQVADGNAPYESAAKTVSNLVLDLAAGENGASYIVGAAVSPNGTPVSGMLPALRAEVGESADICMAGPESDVCAGTDIVGTGMSARWKTSSGEQSAAQFVVMGDVLGSGQLNIAQLVRIARAVAGDAALEGPYLAAGDWDGNGRIDIADLTREAQLFRTGRLAV